MVISVVAFGVTVTVAMVVLPYLSFNTLAVVETVRELKNILPTTQLFVQSVLAGIVAVNIVVSAAEEEITTPVVSMLILVAAT